MITGERYIQRFMTTFFLHDCRSMDDLPEHSVQLMITSPPYNVTKTYNQNLTLAQYLQLLEDPLKECCRVLKSTGVIALNIANVGRKPYIPLDTFVIDILQRLKCTVFQMIWDKEKRVLEDRICMGKFKEICHRIVRCVEMCMNI